MPQGAAKLQAVKLLVIQKNQKCAKMALFSYDNIIHKKKNIIFEDEKV